MRRSDRVSRIGVVLGLTAFVGAVALPGEAWSQSKDNGNRACIDPYESAQQYRNAGDLLKARDELRRCSAATCPALIQSDCTTWLAQVSETIPSVIFAAKLDDESVFDVSVSVDGTSVTSQLDGKPVQLNPGLHTFSFEHQGSPPIEKKLIVAPRESGQIVSVGWKSPVPVAGVPVTPTAPESAGHTGASAGRLLGWTSLGVAVAGVAVGSITGAMMFSARSSAQDACPNNVCGPGGLDDISRARTNATISTVAFSVGGAAAVLGLYLVLRPEHRTQPSAFRSLTIGPMVSLHEGGAWIGAQFE